MWGLESYFDRSRRDKKKYDSKNKKRFKLRAVLHFQKQQTKNQKSSKKSPNHLTLGLSIDPKGDFLL